MPSHTWRAKAGRPARTYIQQLCEDTGCCPEDLPKAMTIGGVAREGQGYPCYQRDMMMMMMIIIISSSSSNIIFECFKTILTFDFSLSE